jgi:hypothetical protein
MDLEVLKLAGLMMAIWIPCFWVAMKITRIGGNMLAALTVSIPSFAVAYAGGYFGGIFVGIGASTIVLYVLTCKLLKAPVFPDAFLTVVVTNVLYLLVWSQLLMGAAKNAAAQ